MTIGVVILAHEHLHRTRELAKAIASRRVKVMIHVDAHVDDAAYADLKVSLSKNAHIDFADRVACEWGHFSLVRAGMGAAEKLLNRWNQVSHVVQISGSCLPVRPIDELSEFLERQQDRDFVESHPADDGDWVIDGLGRERFTLYFPFSWKRQRLLFDASVEVQRKLGITRKLPEGIEPHLGSQWWCLSKATLKGILNDPDLPKYNRFFAKCWIPDEGYVATLARKHSANLVNRSLTLSRFDDQGKPHLYYDDHGDLLQQTDHFFARKIWHGADGLYARFLKGRGRAQTRPLDTDFGLDLLFERAWDRRCNGRQGRLTIGRFPAAAYETQPSTVRDYGAFVGFGHLFDGFETWLSRTTGTLAHGRLFKKNAVQFAGHAQEMPGCIPANPAMRDHNPEQFLCNLLWSNADKRQSLMIEHSDSKRMGEFLAHDPNARLMVMRGGWVLELFQRNLTDDLILKRQAERLRAAEVHLDHEIAKAGREGVRYFDFADLLHNPNGVLTDIQNTLSPEVNLRPVDRILMRDFDGLVAFVARLNDLGINTQSLGDIPVREDAAMATTATLAALG